MRPTPLAHCRPAHSPDVIPSLFIRKANGLCSTPLACHLATLLRAIRSTDKKRRSIERRFCVKNPRCDWVVLAHFISRSR